MGATVETKEAVPVQKKKKQTVFKILLPFFILLEGALAYLHWDWLTCSYLKCSPTYLVIIALSHSFVALFGIVAIVLCFWYNTKIFFSLYIIWVFKTAVILFVLYLGTFFLLKPDPSFRNDLSEKIKGYLNDSNIRDIDLVQRELRCCAAYSIDDYLDKEHMLYKFPKSCCPGGNDKICLEARRRWNRNCWDEYSTNRDNFRFQTRFFLSFSLALHSILMSFYNLGC